MAPASSRIFMSRRAPDLHAACRIGCRAGLRAILFAILGYGALTCHAESAFNFATTPGALPKDVVPTAYRIDIAPDLERLQFSAREEIDVDVVRATDVITVNAVDLAIGLVALVGEERAPARVSIDSEHATASFHFAQPLAAGHHTLAIAYSGRIAATPVGIYYNDYPTPAGTRRMLVTQFEATEARRMFPSWDEPAFKATFQVSVELPSDLQVVSNTPAASTAPAGENATGVALTKTTFARTPRMSTYLLVLCAGHLQRIHAASNGTEIGVWAVEGKAEQGAEALQAAVRILSYYNDYFGVPYPLPKLDLIAVPGNFAAGAMENWGGITFIDNVLLMNPQSSSEATRQQIFEITAHEMAHQWSGDLVTMAWWNDIWLNEGFASWMASKVSDALNPDWLVWQRAHASRELAMSADARSTAHPIEVQIADDSQIRSAFDSISYQKGEAFLRMLEAYLGEDAFRDGMRHYMKAHAYSSATTADLWQALQAASGKPVAQIAAGFTEQPGIPLIRVATACRSGSTSAVLKQERFSIDDPTAAPFSWNVPVQIGVIGGSDPVRTVLVGKTPETFSFPGCGRALKANLGDAGYYRVQYDATALAALTKAYPTLAPADRVDLLADEWALVAAGRVPLAQYLDLTRRLSAESTLVVLSDVIGKLDAIDDLARDAPVRGSFRRYAVQLLRPAFDRVGWDTRADDTNQTVLLRAALIEALGRFGDEAVIAECKRRYASFIAAPASLAPNLRTPVMQTVGRYADQATYEQLRSLGKAASSTEEKLQFYYALAGAQNTAFIAEGVRIALSDEISNGRVNRFLIQLAEQSSDPDLVWKDLVAERAPILAKLPPGRGVMMLAVIAQASSNPAVGRELLALPEAQVSQGARYDAARAAARIHERYEFRTRLLPALSQWLAGH
jgi:aminopeptidase N